MPRAGSLTLPLPPSDPDLVRRLCRLETACLSRRLSATCANGADPLGAIIEDHGRATLFAAVLAPEMGFFNTVHGLEPEHADDLDTIFATPRRHGIRLRAIALPGSLDAALGCALVDAGLRPEEWWSILYREAASVAIPQFDGVRIDRAGPDEALDFARVCCAGFGIATDDGGGAMRSIARWVTDVTDFECYLARCDGQPAAIGVLYRGANWAICRGGHAARVPGTRLPDRLVARRVREAYEAGCDVAVVHTGFATGSQRNQERAGFRLAATCQTWAQPRPDSAPADEV